MKLTLLLALFGAPLASAEGDQWEREIKAAQARVKELVGKANALREEGRTDEARELIAKAEAIEKKIHVAKEKRKAGARKDQKKGRQKKAAGEGPEQIMKDLQAGINALRRLGGHDEAVEHLVRVRNELKKKWAQKERGRGEPNEPAVAKKQLETLRIAMHALLERDRRDGAELLERAIHAAELRLAGRRDREAQEIMRRAPDAGAMTELLMLASKILADLKQPAMARQVGQLGGQYKVRWKREKEHGEHELHRDDRRPETDRPLHGPEGPPMQRMMERVERLEQRLEEVTRLLERALDERRHDRDRDRDRDRRD